MSLLQNEVPQETTEALIRDCRGAGHLVFWNLAPTVARPPARDVLAAVDCLICNRNELAALTGRARSSSDDGEGVEQDGRTPLAWGVRSVIVTLGRSGSVYITPESVHSVPAFPVDAVDTVEPGTATAECSPPRWRRAWT